MVLIKRVEREVNQSALLLRLPVAAVLTLNETLSEEFYGGEKLSTFLGSLGTLLGSLGALLGNLSSFLGQLSL